MAKILIIVLPLPSHIGIHSLLARALRKRGHEVTFGGMKDAQARIESYGLSYAPFFAERLPEGLMKEWLDGDVARNTLTAKVKFYLRERRKMVDHEAFVGDLIRGGYREFLDAVRTLAPDLILVDIGLHTYWALMARMTGIPCVYTSPLLPVTEDPVVPPLSSLLPPARTPQERELVRQAWQTHFTGRQRTTRLMKLAGIPDPIANFQKLARATGCPDSAMSSRTLMFPQLDFPVMVACPPEFEFPEALSNPVMHYVDALIDPDRLEPPFPWEKLDPDRELIFCSLGSVAYSLDFFRKVLDAAAMEPSWQVVVNLGPVIDPAGFQNVPPNVILVNGAPQLGLLRRAGVMINHGGINSVRECIYFGVPQLAFPLFFDQFGAAARVDYHGLGLVGNASTVTPAGLRDSVRQLLTDPGFRSRSQAMAAAFRESERRESAAAFIESRLVGHS